MKRKFYSFLPQSLFLLICILILNLKPTYAQWIKLSIDTKEQLNDIVMLDSATAITVGSGGSILKTNDSEKTWQHKELVFSMIMSWNSISFSDKLNGAIAGKNYIFTTTTGGETWSPIHFSGGKNFISVLCVNPANIYAGDDSGYIYNSRDTGKTWISEHPTSLPINSIYTAKGTYINGPEIFALTSDSLFIKSEDPSTPWHNWGTLGYFYGLGSAAHKGDYSDNGTAYIVGVQGDFVAASVIIRLRPPDSHWYTVGPPSEIGELYGLTIPSSKYVYSCGVNGKILKSSDGGDYWISQETPTTQRLNSISFINNEIGFAVGDSGTILYTQNGGGFDTSKSGQLIPFGLQDKVITSLTGEESSNYFPINSKYIFAGTQDNGIFIKSITAPFDSAWAPLGLEDKSITALTVQHWGRGPVDGLLLYAAVLPNDIQNDSTLIFSREVRLSADTNWIKSDSGINKNVNRINTLNSYHYTGQTPPQPILAGTNFGVYTSFNNYWTQSEMEDENNLPLINSIDVSPKWWGRLAWAAGNIGLNPMAFLSTDKGKTWKSFTLSGYQNTSATSITVNPLHPDSVYVSCDNNILFTSDNGETWNNVFTSRGIFINVLTVDKNDPDNVFAGGLFYDDSHQTPNHGIFLRSTNGGKDWYEPDSNIDMQIKEVTSIAVMENPPNNTHSVFTNYVFIGTKGTGVWQYKYSILTSVNENKIYPDKFVLYQNYPNPFNPTTKIKYDIQAPPNLPKGEALIQLKIYDVLGREVKTLVNETKQPGKYEVEFDASKLSSGVYFYQLKAVPFGRQAGEFIQTKKMILLK